MVLSHCCYSLRVGEAHTVQYNYQALEKHILDKFIHGKPTILSEIPQVVYRKDIYTTDTFNAVREKVNPQVSLCTMNPPAFMHLYASRSPWILKSRRKILSELNTPDRLRDNLDVVDIVLGFLSSSGGKAEKPLAGYMDKVLKMERKPFSEKVGYYFEITNLLVMFCIGS